MTRNESDNSSKKKNKGKFLRRMQTKLWVIFGGVCILFVILIGRIMYIQHNSGKKYEKIVLSQQDYDSKLIPFQRGDIVDARGTVLATSVDVYNVILDCKVLNANKDAISTTVDAITSSFDEIPKEKVTEQLEKNPKKQYVVLAKKVSYEEMSSFLEKQQSEEYKGKIFGIWFEKEYIRQYPYNSLGAATIGYASSGNVGVIGLENQYSSVLNGVNGRTYGYLNSDSNLEQTTIDATNGNNIVLSLDVNIQTACENAIKKWNNEHVGEDGSLGSKHTAALVMNPKNGEILAMAQYPSFDLNNPRDLSAFFKAEDLEQMTEDEKYDKLNDIWQNTCVTYTYEPGSTFKPFTVACGLETGAIQGNETYFCDGSEHVGGFDIHCVNRNGHGEEDIALALSNSCNDALMQMSYAIGPTNFADYQSLFGFGQKTYVDLPGEPSTAGLIYSEDDLKSPVNLATNSFGQNFNTTMVQLASGFCSIVNGGYLYQPHIVTKITDAKGNTVKEIEPTLIKKTVSPEVGQMMRDYLFTVVDSGTGKTAGVDGYTMGGKTGTAEKLPRSAHNYLVSFIGFAPIDDPQLVVYVIIDEPNVADQAHSSFAQQIVHEIFEQSLPYVGVKSSLTKEEEAAAVAARTEATKAAYEAENADIASQGENQSEETPQGEASTNTSETEPEEEQVEQVPTLLQ